MLKQQKINLFCVPSAGSSASIYYPWNKAIGDEIDVIALEYPGHGRKIKQALTHDPDHLANLLIDDILAHTDQPFALFGHSVGASLLWKIEAHLKLRKLDHLLQCKIISARPSPHYHHMIHNYSGMSDAEMVQELKLYNNFPDEILNHPDALHFFLNIIRNDFLLSDHMLSQDLKKSSIPLLAIYGKADPYIQDHQIMDSWQYYTDRWFGAHALEGDHFYFLNDAILKDTLCIIKHALAHIWGTASASQTISQQVTTSSRTLM